MADKLDYKKEYKDLYLPKQEPMLINVPKMQFIMVNGQGEPGGETYQNAMQALYSLSFTIKMSKMTGMQPEDYFEYVVPPLEGLWWGKQGALDFTAPKNTWLWTSMIRQPEFVTPEFFAWAKDECTQKKPEVAVSEARFEIFEEGLCVQIIHIGSYDDELRSMEKLAAFIEDNGLKDASDDVHKHHEIYLSDPRKTAVERLRMVLRVPVEKM